MLALYFPAARAGFVTDFTGWLDQVQNHTFSEYVNRSNFKVVSLYQFTQVVTWVFYQLFGINAWLWHLLFITLHVINATLAAVLFAGMSRDVGADNYKGAVYAGAVMFCITPYISEVIVWEPSFHYLQGLLMILLILRCVQLYIHNPKNKYAWIAGLIYLASTHTLEVFYITPWLVLSLALFYRHRLSKEGALFSKLLLLFFLPEVIMFILRLAEYRLLHGDWVSRVGSDVAMTITDTGLGKGGKHIFNLLFMGRFIPYDLPIAGTTFGAIKNAIYSFCDSTTGIYLFYGIGIAVLIWGTIRFHKLAGRGKVMLILVLWTGLTLILVAPLWFDDMMLIIYDRYTYFTSLFLFMLVTLVICSIGNKYLRIGVLVILMLVNLRYAVQAGRYWSKSSHIVNNLLENIPVEEGKITLLLNNPENMRGVPMIGSWPESEYKLMHNLLVPENPINGKVYDVLSYNMVAPTDGVHVEVLNDSMIRVTHNQWGTWYWYKGFGGYSYENEDYNLNMINGHFYELTVTKPMSEYTFLFQVGDQWKVVDINRKNEEQY